MTVLKHSSNPFLTPFALCDGKIKVMAAKVNTANTQMQYFSTIFKLETD